MHSDIVISPMTLLDIDGVMEIEVRSFTSPWSRSAYIEELLFNKSAMYFTATNGEMVVAYAGIWKVIDEGHVTNIAVHPDYRSQGLGAEMLKAVLKYAQKNKLEKVYLEVRISNLTARNLYKHFGFLEDGVRKKYYLDNGEDAILMSRIFNKNEE